MKPRAPGARTPLRFRLIEGLLSVSLLALFVLPLLALFHYAGGGAVLLSASSPGVRAALSFTLYASGLSLAISLALGVPMGYLLARRNFPGKAVVESVVALPVMVPHLVAGIALLLLFDPTGPIGGLASRLGLPVFDTIWGVVLVMVYVSAPYTVLASDLAFRAVDPAVQEAARCLGASPSQGFRTITLPLASRGIIAGGLLTWARSVSEIGGFLILAYTVYPSGPYSGPATNTISVYIYSLYQTGDLSGAAATASLFVLIAFGLFVAVRLLERFGRLPWGPGGFRW
ncbi:MAG: ABC transporter permease [Thermoplasmata archaeon]|nr:ABC transporter permease [Thermoplasmata archaeon]